jgi:hypothetical protein
MVDFFVYGGIQWLIELLSHFFLGLQEDGTIPCLMVYISLMQHAIHMYILVSTPTSPSA